MRALLYGDDTSLMTGGATVGEVEGAALEDVAAGFGTTNFS